MRCGKSTAARGHEAHLVTGAFVALAGGASAGATAGTPNAGADSAAGAANAVATDV